MSVNGIFRSLLIRVATPQNLEVAMAFKESAIKEKCYSFLDVQFMMKCAKNEIVVMKSLFMIQLMVN